MTSTKRNLLFLETVKDDEYEIFENAVLVYRLRREGEAQLWHLYAANGRFVDADQYRHDIMEALEHGNLS